MKIILTGFMGSGKSAIAKQLSKKLGLNYIGMDELVLSKSGRQSINEIFAKDGETAFREMEIAAARTLRDSQNAVIDTGGGVVMNKINLDYLKENGGIIVYLDTAFETISKRLHRDNTRPLMKDRQKAEKLYIFRKTLYENYTDYTIDTDNKSVEEVAGMIVGLIKSKAVDS